MGAVLSVCTTGTVKIYPKYPEQSDILALCLEKKLLQKGCSNNYSLSEFAARLIAKIPNSVARDIAIDYYINLASKKEHFLLLDYALYLSKQTGHILLISHPALNVLATMKIQHSEFIVRLNDLCEYNSLFLKGSYLDTVVSSLKQQSQLPEFSLQVIDNYLQASSINYKAALQQLRSIHGPELDVLAKRNMKLHHASAHALEIKVRVMQLVRQLNLSCKMEIKEFLYEIVSFMTEFHDYEQVDCGVFSSVEEATADKVLGWLNKALQLDTYPTLYTLFQCLVNKVIILATTMIFGLKQTVDLSELYLLLERHAMQEGHFILHSSNRELNEWINKVMLLIGIADKTPATLTSVVSEQAKNTKVNTALLVKKALCVDELLLETLFSLPTFEPYFANIVPSALEQSQAFFITLAPHVGMSTELLAKKYPESVVALIEFISLCRYYYLFLGTDDFNFWYRNECQQKEIQRILEELFFVSLNGEISFAQSQYAALTSVLATLELCYLDQSFFVEQRVPRVDSANLVVLNSFYKQLMPQQKTQLIEELVLGVVLQAGFIYGQQKEYTYFLEYSGRKRVSSTGFFSMMDKTMATEDTAECSESMRQNI